MNFSFKRIFIFRSLFVARYSLALFFRGASLSIFYGKIYSWLSYCCVLLLLSCFLFFFFSVVVVIAFRFTNIFVAHRTTSSWSKKYTHPFTWQWHRIRHTYIYVTLENLSYRIAYTLHCQMRWHPFRAIDAEDDDNMSIAKWQPKAIQNRVCWELKYFDVSWECIVRMSMTDMSGYGNLNTAFPTDSHSTDVPCQYGFDFNRYMSECHVTISESIFTTSKSRFPYHTQFILYQVGHNSRTTWRK